MSSIETDHSTVTILIRALSEAGVSSGLRYGGSRWRLLLLLVHWLLLLPRLSEGVVDVGVVVDKGVRITGPAVLLTLRAL